MRTLFEVFRILVDDGCESARHNERCVCRRVGGLMVCLWGQSSVVGSSGGFLGMFCLRRREWRVAGVGTLILRFGLGYCRRVCW